MAKSNVIATVVQLSANLADPVSISNFYDEAVFDLGRMPWLTNITIMPVTGGVRDVNLNTTVINLRGVVYGSKWLYEIQHLRDAETAFPDWRDVPGFPTAYVLEQVDHLAISLLPTPNRSGKPVTQVFDSTYPDFNLVVFVTEFRTNIPLWIEWAVAFNVLNREFSRSSDHTDVDAAKMANALSNMMLMMVS